MLIAFNDDVEFRSRMYHIQTEDNGLKNGHITTTVFFSGKTLDSKSSSYLEQIASVTDEESRNRIIKDLMTKQHQMFYQRLFAGEYESLVVQPPPRPTQTVSGVSKTSSSVPPIGKKPPVNRPDILRASQQVPGSSKSLDLKSLSNLAQKSQEASQNSKLRQPGQSSPANSLSSGGSKLPERQPSLEKPLLRSMAVEKERLMKKKKAFRGVVWLDEDLSCDALVAGLMEGMTL